MAKLVSNEYTIFKRLLAMFRIHMQSVPFHIGIMILIALLASTSPILAYITMTSQWVGWRLKSPASGLFTQPFIRAQIKENISPKFKLIRPT